MRLASLRRRFLETAFRLLYNEMAWTYDGVAWLVSTGLWWTWQRTAIPHLAGPRVLEVAVGTGHLLPELGARGLDAVGLELSPHMVRIARRRWRAAGRDLPLCRGAAAALPFATAAFDSVVTTFPTPFLYEATVLAEIARVLRPGGRLVVVEHAAVLQPALLARAITWLYGATDQPIDAGEVQARRLAAAGWTVRRSRERCPRSVAYLAIAEPPPV